VEMAEKSNVEIIPVKNTLAEKVTTCAPKNVDFSAVDEVLGNLTADFCLRLPQEILAIENALTALEISPDNKAFLSVLFRHVHDLKGQAGTFDFNLITVIGNDLCRFLEQPYAMTPRRLKVARYHVEAMKLVADRGLTGDGDEQGRRMIDTLHTMTHKVLNEENPRM
jgi:chemotaxis protein histidine kinase CheA